MKTNLLASSGDCEDEDDDLGSSFLLTSPTPGGSDDGLYPSLLEDLVEKTKALSLTELRNVESWVKHFDAVISEHMQEHGHDGSHPPELSPSHVHTYLEIINQHFLEIYPSTSPEIPTKNCFPKLADILIKRLPIIFGDYLNTEDIEKFSFEQHNMNTEMEEIEEYPPELMSETHWMPQAEISVQRLRDQTRRNQCAEDALFGTTDSLLHDGFISRSRSARRSSRLNNYFKCTFRSSRAFIKIRKGKFCSSPSKSMHFNHPIPRSEKLLKRIPRLEDILTKLN